MAYVSKSVPVDLSIDDTETMRSGGIREPSFMFGSWPIGTAAGTYFVVLNNSGQLEVIGRFIVPKNAAGTFAIPVDFPAGRYAVGSKHAGPGTITVYNGRWSPGGQREGIWSLGDFDPVITATLNHSRTAASNFAGVV